MFKLFRKQQCDCDTSSLENRIEYLENFVDNLQKEGSEDRYFEKDLLSLGEYPSTKGITTSQVKELFGFNDTNWQKKLVKRNVITVQKGKKKRRQWTIYHLHEIGVDKYGLWNYYENGHAETVAKYFKQNAKFDTDEN